MSIIPARELNPITKEDIVSMFCDNLMERIKKANAEGQRDICFTSASIYLQDGKLVSRYTGNDREHAPYYLFSDYADEVATRFRAAGYTIKPTGYIGGVWQRTQDIIW